jgi:hypothetical protein
MRGETPISHGSRSVPCANAKQLACHPEQADVAPRRIRAIRAKRRAAFIKKSRDAKFARLDLARLDRSHFRPTPLVAWQKTSAKSLFRDIFLPSRLFPGFCKKIGRSSRRNTKKAGILSEQCKKKLGTRTSPKSRFLDTSSPLRGCGRLGMTKCI